MSRHKLVKALDLDEELDDYDGGMDSGDDNEVNPEDRGTDMSSGCWCPESVH